MPGRALVGEEKAPRTLVARLGLAFDWYAGMVSEETGRLVYTYDPASDVAVANGSAIRDLASIWDVELLGRFLGRTELLPLAQRSLQHCASYLVDRDGALALDAARLGEPSSIAHSAFVILALVESDVSWRHATIAKLADGILRQQRPGGSYAIYFDGERDDGLELYPGEAMLALTSAFPHDARCAQSVARGFRHYRDRFPPLAVAAGFYEDVERHPKARATVEVACALEGVNGAYAIALREGDAERARAYERCVRTAVAWLFRAQRLVGTRRERGGFGHALTQRAQRIDVTGHAVNGLIKSARNGLEP